MTTTTKTLGRKTLIADGRTSRPYWIPAAHRAMIERFYADPAFAATFPWSEDPSGNGSEA